MRVRMIRPAYWTDADLHLRLTAEQREFYIGLWMLSDDAGYVDWDVDRIRAELYPYQEHTGRVLEMKEWLETIGPKHARLLDCARHVVVPNLERFQSPPKPSYQNKRAHDACLRHMAPPGASGDQRPPAQGRGSIGEGRVGLDKGAAAASLKDKAGWQA